MKTVFAAIVFVFFATGIVRADAIARGISSGVQSHDSAGTAEILRGDGRTIIRFGADSFLDGAPDPKIGFGRNGFVDDTTGDHGSLRCRF